MEVHSTAVVDSSAHIGPGITDGAGALIEADIQLGSDCRVGLCDHPHTSEALSQEA